MRRKRFVVFSPLVALALMASACTGGTPSTGVAIPPQATTVKPATEAPSATPTATETPAPTEVPVITQPPGPTSQPATGETRIQITMGDTVLTGRLWDDATARDLIAQLPLTLTFNDFNKQEKLARLPQELSTDGVPAGDDPLPGDIGYYAPSGDLVFYYSDVGYFNGIVRIGQFDGSVDTIASAGDGFQMTIERIE